MTRSLLAALTAAVLCGGASAAGGGRFEPDAIAFRTQLHGWAAGACRGCGAPGALASTVDGGRTWEITARFPRSVAALSYAGGALRVTLAGGRTLASRTGRPPWRRAPARPQPLGPCRPWPGSGVVRTPDRHRFALCLGQGGLGNQPKAVYTVRSGRWALLACGWWGIHDRGGLSAYGYPGGLAVDDAGFGLLWETRGTLWETRNGGRDWTAEPGVARAELDQGVAGAAPGRGVGYALLVTLPFYGGASRLVRTADAGRTWHVVHRWR